MDFPTPDEPTKATVRPNPHQSARQLVCPASRAFDRLDKQAALKAPGLLPPDSRIIAQVRLGEHDDRRDAGFHRQRKVAFQVRRVEVVIARADDKQCVEIRRDQLRLSLLASGLSLQQRLALKSPHRTMRLRLEQQPVSHGEIPDRLTQTAGQNQFARLAETKDLAA